MEPPATAEAMCNTAAEGDLAELRRLLAADPGLASATDNMGRTPLACAACEGKEAAVRLLLEAAPAVALKPDAESRLPLHWAAHGGSAEAVRLLLEAAPAAVLKVAESGLLPLHMAAFKGVTEVVRLLLEAAPAVALTASERGWFPLHIAAGSGSAPVVRMLLEAAPAAALEPDAVGQLPLHMAAFKGVTESVSLLLETAPAAALTASARGWLPLHMAAGNGCAEAVRLLLNAAPAAATREITSFGLLPLRIALLIAGDPDKIDVRGCYMEIARLLLPATPLEYALQALQRAGEVALPLFADLASCTALSPEQWQRMPAACPALGAALPAVLARSVAEAALLVGCLPSDVRQRLRTGALCLSRAQRDHRTELPAAIVGTILALAAEP